MAETQLDRIENMIKVLTEANTALTLGGSPTDKTNLKARVEGINSAPAGSVV